MNSNNVQNRQSIKILDDYVLSAKVQNGEMRTKYNALESLKLAPDKDTLENTIKRLEGEITALNEKNEILHKRFDSLVESNKKVLEKIVELWGERQ